MPQVSKYVWTLNKDQQLALKRVYDRSKLDGFGRPIDSVKAKGISYRQFRRTVQYSSLMKCAMVRWCGMWLGIEEDGHTHS